MDLRIEAVGAPGHDTFVRGCAVLAGSLGAAGVMGTVAESPALAGGVWGLEPMAISTGAAVLMAAASLLALSGNPGEGARKLGRVLGGSIAVLAPMLYLASRPTGLQDGPRDLMAGWMGLQSPGSFSPVSATCLAGLGIALWLSGKKRAIPPASAGTLAGCAAQAFAGAAAFLVLPNFLGHLLHADTAGSSLGYATMAMATAVAVAALAAGIFVRERDCGVMPVVLDQGDTGWVIRRLMLAAVGIPVVVGWLRLAGESAGYFGASFGSILHLSTSVLFISLVALALGKLMRRLEKERKAAKREVAEKAALLDAVITQVGEGVVVSDLEGRFLIFNGAAERIVGIGATGTPPSKWTETYGIFQEDAKTPFPPEEVPLARALRGLETVDQVLFARNQGNPAGIWMSVSGRPLRDPTGRMFGGFVTLRDITQQRERERMILGLNSELAASNKEMEAFSYSVSHDLRAPLRAINGFAKRLIDEKGTQLDDEARRLLGVVGANAVRMGRLIDDLLEFSRLGRREVRADTVKMGDLAREVLAELKAGPQSAAACDLQEMPAARGDRALLRQVYGNLIGNAFKYSSLRPDPRVEVGGRIEGAHNVYWVRDNGAGFDMRHADRLFGVFSRLHSEKEFEGTGVGLAVVKAIVEKHGGRVWAEGKPGEGAAFWFTLPPAEAS